MEIPCLAVRMIDLLKILDESKVSPFISFTREQWSKLRDSTPLTVSEDDLAIIRGINERISLREVEDIYLPLSRLLNLYFNAAQMLYSARKAFLKENGGMVPYVIGMAGSVAVGKSTTGRLLKTLISRWPGSPRVELIATDGFLLPNSELEKRGLMNRKGFPESYDVKNLIRFLYELKSGKGDLRIPVYSHLTYDIVPGRFQDVNRPDIVILEGLNVLQTRSTMAQQPYPELFVSDFFDFSIYVDADEADIKKWFLDRFLVLYDTAFRNPQSYFRKYSELNREEAIEVASSIWDQINGVNLRQNIAPTKYHAHLILRKGPDHSVEEIFMRKI